MMAQKLASLKQSSPKGRIRGSGPAAPNAGRVKLYFIKEVKRLEEIKLA
jgi:hypothetical protein